ncbi:unnamed protein product [Lymnaea stagnalis]|uniref:Large ribosomal subunit protein mL62 n=1 Tax=Lymnaea stagnalis TaxID=6523 RepID=A0AAV2HAT8_LYMST
MFRKCTISLRHQLTHVLKEQCCVSMQVASFKSHLSIDKIYPNSNPDFLRKSESLTHSLRRPQSHSQSIEPTEPKKGQKESRTKETFSGYIPIEALEISASRSSGPGGQGVNTANSKIEVRFHLESATWIPEWIKPRLSEQEQGRITKDGFFVVRSDLTRKQMLNQADCMNKIRNMIYSASVLPHQPTKEEVKIHEERLAKAKTGILREKKARSLIKQSRSAPEM